MRNYRHIEVRPIAGALGAEIHGVDASRSLEADVVAEMRQALLDHLVIFLRGQTMTPMQQLASINKFAAKLVAEEQALWQTIKSELSQAGLSVLQAEELSTSERDWLEQLFLTRIFPILTPIAADPAHPFPFIPNKAMVIVVEAPPGSATSNVPLR